MSRKYIGDGVYITAEAGEVVLETYRAEAELTAEGYRNWLVLSPSELTAMGAYLALTHHKLALQIAQHMVAVAVHQASVESKATLEEISAALAQVGRQG